MRRDYTRLTDPMIRENGSLRVAIWEEALILGSGNVFADLGLENPAELQAKAMLSIHIEEAMRDGHLSYERAAEATGLSETDLERVVRGDLDSFTLSQLIDYLNRLDRDIEIRVTPSKGRHGQLTVAAVSRS